ncbi:DUF6160 family protein [Marinobacter sp. F4216]|uniref:DUF6160 family protein n=1 Tax=Marinobacter sp. F4216 TaxID=2874281 RepID=UPI001CBB1BA7|nr:DUF6160 family protein [Marinobacter sp. F4216]
MTFIFSHRVAVSVALGLSALIVPALSQGELKRLDDSAMSSISGQSGLTIELDLGVSANQLSYFDDGQGIHLEGFRIGSSVDPGEGAFHLIKLDIESDGALNLDYLVEDRRIEFGDIRLAGAPGLSAGGFFFDHSMTGYLNISSGGGYRFWLHL